MPTLAPRARSAFAHATPAGPEPMTQCMAENENTALANAQSSTESECIVDGSAGPLRCSPLPESSGDALVTFSEFLKNSLNRKIVRRADGFALSSCAFFYNLTPKVSRAQFAPAPFLHENFCHRRNWFCRQPFFGGRPFRRS
jgi:hypothetical protein